MPGSRLCQRLDTGRTETITKDSDRSSADLHFADLGAEKQSFNVGMRPLEKGLGNMGASPIFYAVACSAGTGRSNLGLKNRLPRAAKMIGAKPITAAKTSRPALPITPFLYNP
jgi:hypothetical protein